MSLTNPKNVITEERLSEFYQGILPYLGGMPDILANKFSKADLYSTDEKMIGRWIDGKPIYQKTVYVQNVSASSEDEYAFTVDINNIKWVIDFSAVFINSNDNTELALPVILNGRNNFYGEGVAHQGGAAFIFTRGASVISGDLYLTIQYTKTTDSPVEIGNDTDYSTTEKIVGTWIDGKPIYQKTYTNLNKAGDNMRWVTVADVSSLSIDTIISTNDIGTYNNECIGSLVYLNALQIGLSITKTEIQMYALSPYSAVLQTLTLQYTKTTD